MRRELLVTFQALIVSGVFLVNAFAEDACVVICGQSPKVDWNEAFKFYPLCKAAGKFGRFDCRPVNSWAEADEYIRTKPNLKRNDSLLILQAAHGGPGGSVFCNSGTESPDNIRAYLRGYQQKYKVGALIGSCYSGDLLKQKLIEDALGDQKRLDRMCLVTASSPGRLAWGVDGITSPTGKGMDLEKWALKNDMMLSSSLWSGAGVTDYLIHKTQQKAGKALRAMSELIRAPSNCSDVRGIELAKICVAPELEDRLVKDMLEYSASRLKVYSDGWSNLKQQLNDILESETTPDSELDSMGLARKQCLLALGRHRPYRTALIYSDKYISAEEYRDILMHLQDFRQSPGFTNCADYERQLSERPSKKTRASLVQEQGPPILNDPNPPRVPDPPDPRNSLMVNSRPSEPVILSAILDLEIFDQLFRKRLLEQIETQDRLQKLLGNHPEAGLTDLQAFARALANEEKGICGDSVDHDAARAHILEAALSGSIGFEKFEDEAKASLEPLRKRVFSPYELLSGFQHASASLARPVHRVDRLRRKACRDFKL